MGLSMVNTSSNNIGNNNSNNNPSVSKPAMLPYIPVLAASTSPGDGSIGTLKDFAPLNGSLQNTIKGFLPKPLPIQRGGSGDSGPVFEEEGEAKSGKIKKNERERQRRQVVSEHFDTLHRMLDLNEKDDKISILHNAIMKINALQQEVADMRNKVSAYEQLLIMHGIPIKKSG